MKFSLATVCLLAVYFISSKQFQVLSEDRFTPTWAVRIPGDDSLAQTVAKDHKMIYLGKVIDMMLQNFNCLLFNDFIVRSSVIFTILNMNHRLRISIVFQHHMQIN